MDDPCSKNNQCEGFLEIRIISVIIVKEYSNVQTNEIISKENMTNFNCIKSDENGTVLKVPGSAYIWIFSKACPNNLSCSFSKIVVTPPPLCLKSSSDYIFLRNQELLTKRRKLQLQWHQLVLSDEAKPVKQECVWIITEKRPWKSSSLRKRLIPRFLYTFCNARHIQYANIIPGHLQRCKKKL